MHKRLIVYQPITYANPTGVLCLGPDLGPAFLDLDLAKRYVYQRAEEFGTIRTNVFASPAWTNDRHAHRALKQNGDTLGRIYASETKLELPDPPQHPLPWASLLLTIVRFFRPVQPRFGGICP